jgi:CTP synthase
VADRFHLKRTGVRIHKYKDLVEKYVNGHDFPTVNIGIVGKYANCDEAYISLKEALTHAAVSNNVQMKIVWINAEELEEKEAAKIPDIQGIIIPGGFDSRGVEGKIRAIKYVRKHGIPFLGICLGLQCAVIEFARNVLKIEDATSAEFNKDGTHVIHYVEGQADIVKKSGTMRLGAYDCKLAAGSMAAQLYGRKTVSERHRHRYEVNEQYIPQMEEKGFIVSGRCPQNNLVEVMEIKDHPFFIGTQTHPEFSSRLLIPAPLFVGLVKAAANLVK